MVEQKSLAAADVSPRTVTFFMQQLSALHSALAHCPVQMNSHSRVVKELAENLQEVVARKNGPRQMYNQRGALFLMHFELPKAFVTAHFRKIYKSLRPNAGASSIASFIYAAILSFLAPQPIIDTAAIA